MICDYNFDKKKELKIYEQIGHKNGMKNYGEWENYIVEKYGRNKYTTNSLKNFVHYLKREQQKNINKKENWNSIITPLIVLVITIVFTAGYSIIAVINNYNDAINCLTDKDFLEYTGYTVKMIYEALEQNLYTGMYLYVFGMIIMIISILSIILIMTSKTEIYNLKLLFYKDYIEIIEKIIEK